MDGLFLVKKPKGISSRKIGLVLKKHLGLTKVGHVGTLDLEASGLLLILSNSATRLQNYFLNYNKTYEGVIKLGVTSDTDDIYGKLIEHPNKNSFLPNENALISEIKQRFSPRYNQKPCLVSSKKVSGVTSRKLMKQGMTPNLKESEVDINFDELKFIEKLKLKYKVTVSSGFYVRALARDIGDLLNIGGVAESIDRTRIGPFLLENSCSPSLAEGDISFDNVVFNGSELSRFFIPSILLHNYIPFPSLVIEDELIDKFRHGNKAVLLALLGKIDKPCEDHFFVTTNEKNLLGLVRLNKEANELYYTLVL